MGLIEQSTPSGSVIPKKARGSYRNRAFSYYEELKHKSKLDETKCQWFNTVEEYGWLIWQKISYHNTS